LSVFVFVFIKTAVILGSVKFASLNIGISLTGVFVYYTLLGTMLILVYYKDRLRMHILPSISKRLTFMTKR